MKKLFNAIKNSKIDWMITIVPTAIIVVLCILFICLPDQSNNVLGEVRFFFGDTLGSFYIIIGVAVLLFSIFLAGSDFGKIRLGEPNEKPKYSFFTWGSMMFTCGLAADILFYSFAEWVMYANEGYVLEKGSIQEWAGVFPLFHWSFIPWAFYLVLAVAFGFMLHVRKRNRQRFSESCRPILKKQTTGILGRIIDLFAVFALLAGTATTFTIATPLMATIIETLFHITISRTIITLIILLLTFGMYTFALLHGFKGIGILAKICIISFFGLLIFVFLFSGKAKYILETGVTSLGRMFQNFIALSTETDPLRKTSFPQNWTIYYWAYWMVWCVAAPFFIGNISRGRTIKQVIIGGYIFGVGSTLVSFIILGNFGLNLQVTGMADFVTQYNETGDIYGVIISIIQAMPLSTVLLVVILLTMMLFYATSFDSIAYTAACYSYKQLGDDEKPHVLIELLWCILLILLPIGLVFAESSINCLQSLSIVTAFPLGIIMLLIVISFVIDAKHYKDNEINKEESLFTRETA